MSDAGHMLTSSTPGGNEITTTLSLIVTCFNEVSVIGQLREQLAPVLTHLADAYDIELIFVDDGSTDGTADRIRELWPDPVVRILRHERNRGLGAGLRTGTRASSGSLVLWTDSDCTFPPREIPNILAMLGPDTDVVTGSHYHPDGGVVGVPPQRLWVSRTGSFLYQAVTAGHIRTYTSMFRVYRRDVLERVPRWSDGHVALAETIVFPLLAGRRVAEFPTKLYTRHFGFSKMRLVRTSRDHLKLVGLLALMRAVPPVRRAQLAKRVV